jgi:uncharacterized membrane protein
LLLMRLHHGDGAGKVSGAFAGVMAVTQRPIVSSPRSRTEPMNPIGTITLDTA